MKSEPLRPSLRTCAASACLPVMAAAGCAGIGAPVQGETLSAFNQLAVGADAIRRWRSAEPTPYVGACVAPERITFGGQVALDPAEQHELRNLLRTALRSQLDAVGLRDCDAQAATSLNVRASITRVERARPGLNALTTFLIFVPLSRGGITVELEAIDAASGRRVAAMAFEGRAGNDDLSGAFTDLGHARRQAQIVAARFAELLVGSSAQASDARFGGDTAQSGRN